MAAGVRMKYDGENNECRERNQFRTFACVRLGLLYSFSILIDILEVIGEFKIFIKYHILVNC